MAPAGGVTLRGSALVRDSGLPDAVAPDAQQLPIDQLPDEVLLYLMASRYCETDKLTDIAWSLFGNTRPGWERVAAICSFVHDHVTFGYAARPPHEIGASTSTSSAPACAAISPIWR